MSEPFSPSAVDLAPLGGDAVGRRPHRARVHAEPLRAGALRGGAQGRGRHPRTSRSRRPRPRRCSTSGWRASARASQGYVTPKVAVAADRRQREGRDPAHAARRLRACGSTRSATPTSGTRRREIAVKEVYEETGIEVEPVSLIAVLDGLRLGFARLPLYSLLFHCRMLGGELQGPSARDARGRLLRPQQPAVAASPASTAGASSRSPPSTARSGPATSTRPAPHPGAATTLSSFGSARAWGARQDASPAALSSVMVKRGRSSTPRSASAGRATRLAVDDAHRVLDDRTALAQVAARDDHLTARRHDVFHDGEALPSMSPPSASWQVP